MVNNRKVYDITSQAKSRLQRIAQHAEPKLIPQNFRFYQRPGFLPVVVGAGIWAGCSWYAYEVYTNTDHTVVDNVTGDLDAVDDTKEADTPKTFSDYMKPRDISARGFKNCEGDMPPRNPDGSPVISINYDLERIEIVEQTPFGVLAKTVPFCNVEKSENGDLLFYENGYPVFRTTPLGNLAMGIWNSIKSLFGS